MKLTLATAIILALHMASPTQIVANTNDDKLRIAVTLRSTKKAEKAVAKGADTNHIDAKSGKPILLTAVEVGFSPVIAVLLKNGADPELPARDGSTSLTAAVQSGRPALVQQLVASGASVNAGNSLLLHKAVIAGHLEIARQLLEAGAAVDSLDKSSKTPLYFAVNTTRHDIAVVLLEHGADVNARNSSGSSLLMLAAEKKDRMLVYLLLEKGADLTIKNATGSTIVEVALKNKDYALAAQLEKYGALIRQKMRCNALLDTSFSNSPMQTGCYECDCILDLSSRLVWTYPFWERYTLPAARREVSRLNETRYLGRADWRIPRLKEQESLLRGAAGPDGRGFQSNHPLHGWGGYGTTFYWNSDVPEPRYIEYNGLVKGRQLVMDPHSVINLKYRSTFSSNNTEQRLWIVAGPGPGK